MSSRKHSPEFEKKGRSASSQQRGPFQQYPITADFIAIHFKNRVESTTRMQIDIAIE